METGEVVGSLVLAGALLATAFITAGGVDQTVATPGNTWVDMAITVVGAVVVSATVVLAPQGRRWGMGTALMMAALTAFEGLSILWSVLPDNSWMASDQMLAYLAAFAAAVTVARTWALGWRALIAALALATTVLCAWSLLAKVFPATLAVGNMYGRLQAPFGYWNAIGVSAAVGLPCCMWLGSRRARADLSGAAGVGLVLILTVLVLSSSRSADLAAIVAVVVWFALVSQRLRAAALLATAAVPAAGTSAWALTHRSLSHDGVAAAAQDVAGHMFGIVLLGAVVLAWALGALVARELNRASLTVARPRATGGILLAGVALCALAVVGAVALSHRGLGGEISHGLHELTNSQASVNNNASRVFQLGSARPVYWHEGITVGDHAVLKGVGELGFAAARLRYTLDATAVQQVHSYVFETYADLGIIGLVLTAGLLGSWLVAAARPLALGARSGTLPAERSRERDGMATLAAVVIGFGVQSMLDWTWYFAGVAIPVLLAAGWLAGRGPLAMGGTPSGPAAPRRSRSPIDRPAMGAGVLLIIAVTLLGVWMQWRPLGSADDVTAAENASNGTAVLADARAAQSDDPFNLFARQQLAEIYLHAGRTAEARSELARATTMQPGNPYAWAQLASFDFARHDWQGSLDANGQVIKLDQPSNATRLLASHQVIVARAELARASTGKAG